MDCKVSELEGSHFCVERGRPHVICPTFLICPQSPHFTRPCEIMGRILRGLLFRNVFSVQWYRCCAAPDPPKDSLSNDLDNVQETFQSLSELLLDALNYRLFHRAHSI